MQDDIIGIYVEEDAFLLSAFYKHKLAVYLVGKALSRQGTTNWLASTICEYCTDDDKIFDGDGDEIIIYDEIFDDAYFDDASHCWNTDIKRFAAHIPKRQSPERLLLRLQLFDAAMRITGDPIERP